MREVSHGVRLHYATVEIRPLHQLPWSQRWCVQCSFALAIQIYFLLEVDRAGNGTVALNEFESQLQERPIRRRIFGKRFTPKCSQVKTVKVDSDRLFT